jgi:aminoglycoside 3-N-acetyltransferase
MSPAVFSIAEITVQLKNLGIREGDTLLVHSALRTLGKVENGASGVLESLKRVLGKDGTLLMPSFQSGSEYIFASQGICFDVKNTPSECGYLTEFFRQQPDTFRSLSSTHSLAAWGKYAEVLLQDHEMCSVTTGWGSPFEKFIDRGGKILMLGAVRGSNTTMHHLENTGGAPTLCAISFETSVITRSGEKILTPIYPHMPGLHRDYSKAIDLLEQAGGLSAGPVGNAQCELYDARKLRSVVYEALRKNPCAFVKVFTPGKA